MIPAEIMVKASEEKQGVSLLVNTPPKDGSVAYGMGEKYAANPVTSTNSIRASIQVFYGQFCFKNQASLSDDLNSLNEQDHLFIQKAKRKIVKYYKGLQVKLFKADFSR